MKRTFREVEYHIGSQIERGDSFSAPSQEEDPIIPMDGLESITEIGGLHFQNPYRERESGAEPNRVSKLPSSFT